MTKRRMVQLGTFLALNAGAFVQLKWLCPQIMYCHACPASVVACPIGVIGSFLAAGLVPLFVLGLLAVVGALVGRLLCGWVCPFGLFQDLLAALPVKPRSLPRWTRGIKYAVLATMVVAVPLTLGTGSVLYYCRTCPVATTTAILPAAATGAPLPLDSVSQVRYALLAGVIVLCVLVPRGFCRVLCPVAALVAPLNEVAALAVRVTPSGCRPCAACRRACPMGLEPAHLEGSAQSDALTRTECISCNACTAVCPGEALKLGLPPTDVSAS